MRYYKTFILFIFTILLFLSLPSYVIGYITYCDPGENIWCIGLSTETCCPELASDECHTDNVCNRPDTCNGRTTSCNSCDYSPSCTINGASCGNCGTYTGCSTACSGGCTGCTCSGDATANGGACSDGNDCCSGSCVNGYCRADCSTFNGLMCSEDSNAYNGASGGVCIGSTCDTNEVCHDGFTYQPDCSSCYVLDGCDSNVGPGYSAEGICITDNSCDNSGEACYSGGNYKSDCSICEDGAKCDSDVSDGTYVANGVCNGGGCYTSLICPIGKTKFSRLVDESVMENDFSDDLTDLACCDSPSAAIYTCVFESNCYEVEGMPPSFIDVDSDGDGDNDYCNSDGWVDCNTDDQCNDGYICSTDNNCTLTPPQNGDDNSVVCADLGGTWLGTESISRLFPPCCGDDLDEYYITTRRKYDGETEFIDDVEYITCGESKEGCAFEDRSFLALQDSKCFATDSKRGTCEYDDIEYYLSISEDTTCTPKIITLGTIICGDGKISIGEECDDDNTNSEDGCDSNCQIEDGWICLSLSNLGVSVCSREPENLDMCSDCGEYPDCYAKTTYYQDLDSDGYGNLNNKQDTCSIPEGYVENSNDCDDDDGFNFPSNVEKCDNRDNDCNEIIDDITSENILLCSDIGNLEIKNTGVCEDINAICTNGKWECNFPENYVVEETNEPQYCDNLDNDCDDNKDELCSCSPGDEQTCGSNIGECSKGTQICSSSGEWEECNSNKPVTETCDNKDNDCDGKIDDNIKVTCTKDNCQGYRLCVDGNLNECFTECSDIDNVKMKMDNSDKKNLKDDAELTQDEFNTGLKTLGNVEQNITSQYQTGITYLSNTIKVDEPLEDVKYALYIPKCLSPYLEELNFENINYTIIKDDPVIAWHFKSVEDELELNYQIEGRVSPQCLEKIKGMPIANVIGASNNNEIGWKVFILPLGIIISAVVLFGITKIPTVEKKPKTEQEFQENFIKKQRTILLKKMKEQKFLSREQANNYMKNLGLKEEDRNWLIEKLKF